MFDQSMLAGASGIVRKAELARMMIRAIECVHNRGELWFDRATTTRVLKRLLAVVVKNLTQYKSTKKPVDSSRAIIVSSL